MAFCENCGTQLNDGTKFCPKCGQTIGGNASTPVQNFGGEGEEEMKTWQKIVSVLVWPAGAILTIVAFSRKQTTLAKTALIYTIIGLVLSLGVRLLSSCASSTDDLEREVKKAMIENAKSNGQNMTISNFALVHKGGNDYTGIATCTIDGERMDLNVYVVCDGSKFQAEWAPTEEYQAKELEKVWDELM